MTSRSFLPSYLASAPSRTARPGFSRTNSSSSNVSTKSDDSLASVLKGLTTTDKETGESDTNARAVHSIPTSNPPSTPGRKRSQPIAIELPSSRAPKVYTPLTARGDLIGGYFPNHDDSVNIKSYQPHPFHNTFASSSTYPESPIMSASSSFHPSPTTMAEAFIPIPGPISPLPESLLIPKGKYHPSNYVSPANTSVSSPQTRAFLPPPSLSIPTSTKRSGRPGHERKSSDIKRKLQQYQRDMNIKNKQQAELAARNSTSQPLKAKAPISPRLAPAGSPGPITPFELEDEQDGYIIAGNRARGKALDGDVLQNQGITPTSRVHPC